MRFLQRTYSGRELKILLWFYCRDQGRSDPSVLLYQFIYLPFRKMKEKGKGLSYRMPSTTPTMIIPALKMKAEVVPGVAFTIRTFHIDPSFPGMFMTFRYEWNRVILI